MDLDFTKVKIAVIGDIMLDRTVFGYSNRMSPEAPVPIFLANERETYSPGGAANTAFNAANLGAKVDLYGFVGDDHAKILLFQYFNSYNIGHENILVLNEIDYQTTLKTRYVTNDTNHQMFRIDREVVNIDPIKISKLLIALNNNIKNYDAIIVSDYNKGIFGNYSHSDSLYSIFQSSRESNIPVFVDPKDRFWKFYSNAFCITPNFKEFRQVCTTPIENKIPLHPSIRSNAQRISAECHLDHILITLGHNGMALYCKQTNSIKHIYTDAQEVFDVCGAGDTVIATLAVSYAKIRGLKYALVDSARLANLAAKEVIRQPGTVPITLTQLRAVVKKELTNGRG